MVGQGTEITLDKMRAAMRALDRAEALHRERMADPVQAAIYAGLACPIDHMRFPTDSATR